MVAFATSNVAGANFTEIFTPPSATDGYNIGLNAPFDVGQVVEGTDGSAWLFVQLGTGGTTGPGYVCIIDENYEAVMVSTSNDIYGGRIGVPICAAALDNDYIWLQIAGTCPGIRVAALCAENIALGTTGTAGVLDDAGGLVISGIAITTTAVGASSQPGVLSYPVQTATAGA